MDPRTRRTFEAREAALVARLADGGIDRRLAAELETVWETRPTTAASRTSVVGALSPSRSIPTPNKTSCRTGGALLDTGTRTATLAMPARRTNARRASLDT
jgi:hypothetical protein